MATTIDPALEQRRPKGKRRRRQDINTNHLKLYDELKPRNLQAVLLDSAVWICAEDDVVHMLDSLCFGNLDGGTGTADHIKTLLKTVGKDVLGNKAVRLSIDEAFFMAYALNIITVHGIIDNDNDDTDSRVVELDNDALWQRLQVARRDFVLLYLAYHHFRSKGWIVRTGLQYGADFVLYQRHPALAHSDYSVLILPDNTTPIPYNNTTTNTSNTTQDNSGNNTTYNNNSNDFSPMLYRPPIDWHDVQIANRLSTQVGKRLLLFHVRQHHSSDEYNSPKCLSRFSVEERIIRRWVPESMRPA